ncbi:OprD family porin [Pseudomonas gingeri]|uniref:OprD family porin n=1 Tax=Pseudomonas gingeri TaxID=117681 RepID=A0A7Y7YH73_9PSED|nr:OprD family porin [Pseudomonas gingeri]NWA17337.1 OprD family porin [Pseudomonas gingeri]NWA56359.1 OprD family porin [Pseudomonas gingeri]NWA98079.1 OprD family porin [Pseudomonas gingeri]NWB02553.1 OprD family porin [Pseudomonas gingeri]
MRKAKMGVAVAVVAMSGQQFACASAQSDSKGFVDDTKIVVNARNMYMQRDNRASGAAQNYGEEWAQGFIGTIESGFTQGTIGFGVDALGMLGLKLDTGDGRTGGGTALLEQDGHGAKDEYSKGGGVFKARISNTVLKYGTQIVTLPILNMNDTRLLPETVDGFSLVSKEIKDLRVDAGHFTALTNRNQSSHDSQRMTAVDYLGGTYKFTDRLSSGLYYATTENYYKKLYANTSYLLPFNQSQSLKFDFNGYHTESIGDERSGDLDNNIWSFATTFKTGAHQFMAAYQQVSGKGDYLYGADGGANYFFANSVQYSDFDYEDEKSWQLRYDLDMTSFGVPGLSFMTRYVKGYDFKNGRGVDLDGKAWERNIEGRYVVQSGVAKNLTFRVRQASYRSDDRGGKIDEIRVITEYPINIF